jgi:hypothetical protein
MIITSTGSEVCELILTQFCSSWRMGKFNKIVLAICVPSLISSSSDYLKEVKSNIYSYIDISIVQLKPKFFSIKYIQNAFN